MTNLSLDTYRLLGRSGLRVSPLALGTMTFGTDWGWGADSDEARRIFDALRRPRRQLHRHRQQLHQRQLRARCVGEFAGGRRERLVLATKYTLPTPPGDPNSGGNHRKSMVRSVEEQPAAAEHRLHRPALSARLGRHHAGRGDPAGMDDLVRAGQGALRRHLRHAGLAGVAHAGDRRPARLGPAGRAADRVQPDRAHGRARADPDGARDGPGRDPLVAAGAAACSPASTAAPI